MFTLLGVSAAVATGFVILFGLANGLITIARGTVPLALFGSSGYGRLFGRIARPTLVMQASGPLVLAFVAERFSDQAALALAATCTIAALLCFAAHPAALALCTFAAIRRTQYFAAIRRRVAVNLPSTITSRRMAGMAANCEEMRGVSIRLQHSVRHKRPVRR